MQEAEYFEEELPDLMKTPYASMVRDEFKNAERGKA